VHFSTYRCGAPRRSRPAWTGEINLCPINPGWKTFRLLSAVGRWQKTTESIQLILRFYDPALGAGITLDGVLTCATVGIAVRVLPASPVAPLSPQDLGGSCGSARPKKQIRFGRPPTPQTRKSTAARPSSRRARVSSTGATPDRATIRLLGERGVMLFGAGAKSNVSPSPRRPILRGRARCLLFGRSEPSGLGREKRTWRCRAAGGTD